MTVGDDEPQGVAQKSPMIKVIDKGPPRPLALPLGQPEVNHLHAAFQRDAQGTKQRPTPGA